MHKLMPFLIDNYTLVKKIAEGGMSQLFLAVEVLTSRVVVIKKMALPAANRSVLLQRFQNEVSNTSSLTHNNIISIIDYGNDDENFYVVMEHVDGIDFNKFISDISFDRKIGFLIILKALQALRFAHNRGIIHCDIKPSNILIDKNGRIVLSDFGLSQEIDHNQDLNNFTTPLFMPPEQAYLVSEHAGVESDKWVDTVSILYNDLTPEQVRAITERGIEWDIWSAGVLLYRVCTGYYPFQENDFAALLKAIMYSDPIINLESIPDLPYSVASVIQKCLQKDPGYRPKSLDQVISVLQKYFHSLGISDENETIAAYMRNSDLYSNTEIPATDKKGSYASDLVLKPKNDSEWQCNDFLESLTQNDSQTTPSQPIKQNQQIRKQNQQLKNEKSKSKTEDTGLKTEDKKSKSHNQPLTALDDSYSKPNENETFGKNGILPQKESEKSIPGNSELESGQDEYEIPRFDELQKDKVSVSEGVHKRKLPFSGFRLRLAHVITVLTVIFLGISGIFVFKQHPGMQNVSKGQTANHDNISRAHMIPEVKTPEKAILSMKDTVDTLPHQEKMTTLPDSGKKQQFIPAQVKSEKPSQKPKTVRSVNPVVVKSADTTVHFTLPGILKISIRPNDAQVYFEGTLLSQDEIINGRKIAPGKYIISANAAGYMRYSQYINIESNRTLVLDIDLKPDAKGSGQLHIYSYPWANLYIDDELVGTTPTPSPVLLGEGDHDVVLKRDGFEPYSEVVTIRNGETIRLKVELKKAAE
jgi:serine/threonine protein kinase